MTDHGDGVVRLLSYNVLSMRMSVPALIDVINGCGPDIVCMQEAPRFLFWRRRLAGLADATGLRVAACHRRAGAVAVLVRPHVEILEAAVVRLPWRVGRHQRGVATAHLRIHGSELTVSSVHLSLYADERASHLPLILQAAEKHGGNGLVIAGDLNETDVGDVWRQLAGRYQDAYAVTPDGGRDTFSAVNPHKRIDAVFVGRDLTVLGCGVPEVDGLERASDHRPVLARLQL